MLANLSSSNGRGRLNWDRVLDASWAVSAYGEEDDEAAPALDDSGGDEEDVADG